MITISIGRKEAVFFGAVILVFVIAGLAVAYNSGANPAVMGHSADEIEGVCRTDGSGCPTGLRSGLENTPHYTVKYKTAITYSPSDFSSYDAMLSWPSFGGIWAGDSTFTDGSYLFEMKVNVTSAVTKTIKVYRLDNEFRVFVDGTLKGSASCCGAINKDIVLSLTPGEHNIQIIFTAEGADDYLNLGGDIIDNQKVFFIV